MLLRLSVLFFLRELRNDLYLSMSVSLASYENPKVDVANKRKTYSEVGISCCILLPPLYQILFLLFLIDVTVCTEIRFFTPLPDICDDTLMRA